MSYRSKIRRRRTELRLGERRRKELLEMVLRRGRLVGVSMADSDVIQFSLLLLFPFKLSTSTTKLQLINHIPIHFYTYCRIQNAIKI